METYTAITWIDDYAAKCPQALALLRNSGVEVHFATGMDERALEALIPKMNFAIAGVNCWDEAMFEKAERLQLLSKFGSGVDNIDLTAAKRHGVRVCNTRGGNTNAVAELVMGLIISMLRGICQSNAELHRGQWVERTGIELGGKTVGIIGFGLVGKRLAHLLSPFGVTLLAHDLHPDHTAAQLLGVRFLPLNVLLAKADIVSLHVPATPENIGLLGRGEFSAMKYGIFLANTARSGIIDAAALLEALDTGKVAMAALDVFSQEPADPRDPLIRHERILCTAHCGGSTTESHYSDSMTSVRAILDVIAGNTPDNLLV